MAKASVNGIDIEYEVTRRGPGIERAVIGGLSSRRLRLAPFVLALSE